MNGWIVLAGFVVILAVCQDAFEVMLLPRRPIRRLRMARAFYAVAWRLWRTAVPLLRARIVRESWLSAFGPFSMVLLLIFWAAGLIFGYALLSLGFDVPLNGGSGGLAQRMYLSGATFFTVGFGDLTPTSNIGRFLYIAEAGSGLGFLAVVIGYFPVLYQAFSRRELAISLLDARAGSPPTAAEVLRRCGREGLPALDVWLHEWEHWSAELMESHISFPLLCYYRSQHDNQSWLASLSMVLDTCALIVVGLEGVPRRQAQLTFAMARHAIGDLSQVFNASPRAPQADRLGPEDFVRLTALLRDNGLAFQDGEEERKRLGELRGMYEPFVAALASHLQMSVPPFILESQAVDAWRTTAWGKIAAKDPAALPHVDEH